MIPISAILKKRPQALLVQVARLFAVQGPGYACMRMSKTKDAVVPSWEWIDASVCRRPASSLVASLIRCLVLPSVFVFLTEHDSTGRLAALMS